MKSKLTEQTKNEGVVLLGEEDTPVDDGDKVKLIKVDNEYLYLSKELDTIDCDDGNCNFSLLDLRIFNRLFSK